MQTAQVVFKCIKVKVFERVGWHPSIPSELQCFVHHSSLCAVFEACFYSYVSICIAYLEAYPSRQNGYVSSACVIPINILSN